MISRGEIYWINLDPVVGSEISKTRPGLVISNDINNNAAETITILPVTTSTSRVYPFEVLLPKNSCGLKEESKVKANQIRTVDKRRVGRLIGAVDKGTIEKIETALKIHLDIK